MTKEQKILSVLILIVILAVGVWYISGSFGTGSVDNQVATNTNINSNVNTNPASIPIDGVQNVPVTLVTSTSAVNTNTNTATNVNKLPTKTISFEVPEGHTNSLTINVTLTNGVMSDISFTQNSSNRESREYADKFTRSFPKSSIVGKKISDISLSRVGGASLTSNAFNKALSQMAE